VPKFGKRRIQYVECVRTDAFHTGCHEMHDNVFLELKTIVHYPNRSGVRAQNMHSTYLANKEKTYLDCHKASRTGSHTSRRASRLLTRPWCPRVTAVQSLSSCSVGGQAARQLSALCPTLGREAVRRSL